MSYPRCQWRKGKDPCCTCESPVYGLKEDGKGNPVTADDCNACPAPGHFDVDLAIRKRLKHPALAEVPGGITPLRVLRIMTPGGSSQGSLIDYRGRLLLVYRQGLEGATIPIADLGAELPAAGHQVLPVETWEPGIEHPWAEGAREDPRVFLFRGKPHVFWNGVKVVDKAKVCKMFLSELTPDLRGVRVSWEPFYEHATWPMEKNWQGFEHDGQLYCVYSIEPHVILRMDAAQAVEVHRTSANLSWDWGHLRGGAPPVRVGDEFYHFFHGQTTRVYEGQKHYVYACGVYTFEARPPFSVKRFAKIPVALPIYGEGTPRRTDLSVVFPCGAVRRGETWYVSYGYNDGECRLALFGAQDVEKLLKPLHDTQTMVQSVAPIARGYAGVAPGKKVKR